MATITIKIKDFQNEENIIETYVNNNFSYTEQDDENEKKIILSYKIPVDFISKLDLEENFEFVGLYSKKDAQGELIAFLAQEEDTTLTYTNFAIEKLVEQLKISDTISATFYATYGIRDVPDLDSEIEALPGIRAVQIGPYDAEDEHGNIVRQTKYYKIIGSNHFDEVYTGKLYITGTDENALFEMGTDCLMISFVREELELGG